MKNYTPAIAIKCERLSAINRADKKRLAKTIAVDINLSNKLDHLSNKYQSLERQIQYAVNHYAIYGGSKYGND